MTVSLSVRHAADGGGSLDVDTSDQPPWGDGDFDSWRLLNGYLHRAVPPGRRLRFPLTLTVDRWEQDVPVDGRPVRFVFVGNPTTWRAVGTVAGRAVTVGGTGWPCEGLALDAVDPWRVSAAVPPPH